MIVTDKDKIINGLRAEVKVATNLSEVVRLGLRRPPLSYQGLDVTMQMQMYYVLT
jgi:hypothetical protein